LEKVWQAHGGLHRWQKVKAIKTVFRAGGWLFRLKGGGRALSKTEIKIFPDQSYAKLTPYPSQGFQGGLYREKVWIENIRGETVAERIDPASYFKKFRRKFRWDKLDTLYFSAYAMWNYLTLPFLLANPELTGKELEPCMVDGERWHRLKVEFPSHIPTHCPEQILFFDDKGFLRRHDYTALAVGKWAKACHYSWNHREFDGLVFPTTRRVWPRFKNKPFKGFVLVALDIEKVEVEYEG